MQIVCECMDCLGYGVVSDRHPNDPSARDVACSYCDGSGEVIYEESYDSEEEARADYPTAMRIINDVAPEGAR